MFGTYQTIQLPFCLGYMFKDTGEAKGQGQRLGSQVRVKGRGQWSMSRANIWHIAVDKITKKDFSRTERE